jgi:hypothetical protein
MKSKLLNFILLVFLLILFTNYFSSTKLKRDLYEKYLKF